MKRTSVGLGAIHIVLLSAGNVLFCGQTACGPTSSSDAAASDDAAWSCGGHRRSAGACVKTSPDCTTVPPASRIVDAADNVWTLQGGQIAKNGTIDPITANVILLVYQGGGVYQETSDTDSSGNNLWWVWSGRRLDRARRRLRSAQYLWRLAPCRRRERCWQRLHPKDLQRARIELRPRIRRVRPDARLWNVHGPRHLWRRRNAWRRCGGGSTSCLPPPTCSATGVQLMPGDDLPGRRRRANSEGAAFVLAARHLARSDPSCR